MRKMKVATLLAAAGAMMALGGALLRAQNPVPFVSQPLVPGAAVPGGPAFTLTVNGSLFVAGATVNWNGQPLKSAFVSGSRLTALVPQADIATAGTASITVTNPGTGVASNVVFFQVTSPESMVYYKDAPGYPAGYGQSGGPQVSVRSMAVGHLIGNGWPSLALAGTQSTSPPSWALGLLSGNGDGTFSTLPAQAPSAGLSPSGITAGDLTGNGRPDLAVAVGDNNGSGAVAIELNNGDGTFSPAPGSPVSVGPAPAAVAMGDFNRDGKLDLAVLNSDLYTGGPSPPAGSLTILLGKGGGTFTQAPGSPLPAPSSVSSPMAVAVGDFNGDGVLDLALAGDPDIWVLLGNGDGTFANAPGSPFGVLGQVYSFAMASGDFNGDGRLDLAVTGLSQASTVAILLGDGDGTFTQVSDCCGIPSNLGAFRNVYTDFMTMGDFNADGKLDLALLSNLQTLYPVNLVQMFLGKGDGTFAPTDYAVLMNPGPTGIGAGDFDGDGKLDMAATGGAPEALWSFVQVAKPTWPTPPDFTISAKSSSLTVAPGASVTDDITVSSQYGFYGPVTVSCAGDPPLTTCSLAPPTQLMAPTENLLPTLTITTTAPPVASSAGFPAGRGPYSKAVPLFLWTLFAVLICWQLATGTWRKAAYARTLALAALVCLGSLSSCGGAAPPQSSPKPPGGGTPPGTYTITVTAVSSSGGGLSHSVPIKLVVQ